MNLTAEQLQENWDVHLGFVNKHISEPRRSKVLEMFSSLEEVMVMAPASSKHSFHNAFPGGYVEHVNRVVTTSIEVAKMWRAMGGTVDFTAEELIFSALIHDLGKVSDGDNVNYIPQDNAWRRDNLGEIYTSNPEMDYMITHDRTLFLLQKFGISLTKNEYFAVRLHSGLYDEANKSYFINYNESYNLKANIVYVLSTADFMSAKFEYDRYKNKSIKK